MPAQKRTRMLIVDDMEMNRTILRDVFAEQFEIIEANTGKEALEIMRSKELSIVLLDNVMPDMDGPELLRIRKNEEKLRTIPVVILSSNDNIEDQVEAFKLNANDYLIKPVNPALASLRIDNIISNHLTMQEYRREREVLMDQVERDQATGLLNKATTESLISQILKNDPEETHALLVIDIDNFKSVNDTDGHAVGDRVIRAIGKLLFSTFRQSDIMGRIGGDEFAVLMVNVKTPQIAQKKAAQLGTRLSQYLDFPISVVPTLSIGYTFSNRVNAFYDVLFRQADEALYDAKRSGKGHARQYGGSGQEPAAQRRRTVLIAEDNNVNRKILAKNLSCDYTVLETANGQEALDILGEKWREVDAIMLDLIMPVMDGFEFLTVVHEIREYSNIPIIVATGNDNPEHESRVLKLGAWDFVTKPYNMEVLKFRLNNAIIRSQLSAFNQLKYLAEFDSLTGIYNKRKFFELTRDMLLANEKQQFIFIRFDLDNFKLINAIFGSLAGDRFLRWLAKKLHEYASAHPLVTYGHIEADVFCVCMPFESRDATRNSIKEVQRFFLEHFEGYRLNPSFGLYVVDDHTMNVESMYDYAILAAKQSKGNYENNYAFFEQTMMDRIERDNELTGQMQKALESGQFVVYYQPKYKAKTNLPCGGEALVRWMHPKEGMIVPCDFIPLFEKNGFITQLDRYVWEQVCKALQKWRLENRPLFPISVNVSRVNFYSDTLIDTFVELTDRYSVDRSLLNLEITESVYAENPKVIAQTVARLQEKGFIVMMDDFGSGYSSLNVLKDLPVDVLKIDMKFLPDQDISRASYIFSSVVHMAKGLKTTVIVEGVETKWQAQLARNNGADYIQGYYYARPMDLTSFEHLNDTASTARKKLFSTIHT